MKKALFYKDYCIFTKKPIKSNNMKLYIRLSQLLLEKSEREKKVYHIKDIAPLFPEITYDGVRKWFVGHTEPKADYLIRLAKFFDVSIDRLLGEEAQGFEAREKIVPYGIDYNPLISVMRGLSVIAQKDLLDTFLLLANKTAEKERIAKKKSETGGDHRDTTG